MTGANVAVAAAFSVGLLFVGLAVAVIIVTTWPADHFRARRTLWGARHPVVRGALHLLKNVAGFLVFLVGVFLSVPGVPGPGFVVIFIGMTLVDFPGKRRVELWILRKPTVHHVIDRVRARFGRPPLDLDVPDAPAP